MKKWILLGAGGVALLSTGTILWTLGPLERDLTKQTLTLLNQPEYTGGFKAVTAKASGQEITLEGSVATEEEKDLASKIAREQVRLKESWGAGWNPVIAVYNHIKVDPKLKEDHPRPWLLLGVYGERAVLRGALAGAPLAEAADKAAKGKITGAELHSEIDVEKARPGIAWDQTLAAIPALKAEGKNKGTIAISTLDGKWSTFPDTVTNAELRQALKGAEVHDLDVTAALRDIRRWQAEAAALAAAPKEEPKPAVAKAPEPKPAPAPAPKPAVSPPPPIPQPPAPVPAPAAPAVAAPATPARTAQPYLLWTWSGADPIRLLGRVPSDGAKEEATQTARNLFTGHAVDNSGVQVDAALPAAAGAFQFGKAEDLAKPFIGFSLGGSAPKLYSTDVYDSEIARDFPQLALADGEIGTQLASFRTALVQSGSLTKDDPYLSLLSDGKTLTVVGEVATDAERTQILDAVKAANTGVQIVDKLTVTPLVNTVALGETLAKLPSLPAGQSGVASARPGHAWRSGSLHAIYFRTGSDRSRDQERALYQVRRVLQLNSAATFEIVGNTDNVGSEESNVKLSEERAEKFANYLTQAGISKDKITSRGAGPKEPIASNDTDEGKAQNRRVDVLLK